MDFQTSFKIETSGSGSQGTFPYDSPGFTVPGCCGNYQMAECRLDQFLEDNPGYEEKLQGNGHYVLPGSTPIAPGAWWPEIM